MEDTVAQSKPAPCKSQIEADIAAARARLSANVEGLINEVHPKAVVERQIDGARAFVNTEISNAKSQIKDEAGWRLDRIALAGGVVAGALAVLLAIRVIVTKLSKTD